MPRVYNFAMAIEWTHFAEGDEPEVFTMNMCERFFEDAHKECPGWMKYDAERMSSPKAKEGDTVFCICPCHKKRQASGYEKW